MARIREIKAAVLRKRGGPLGIEPLAIEGPRDDEVLVRVVASGICRTDIDFVEEWGGEGRPVVLGHEGAGIVEETGKKVSLVKPGDHVVLSYQSCGLCGPCLAHEPFDCERFWDLNFGFERLDGTNAYLAGGVLGHFFGQSSFATYTLATERNIVPVRSDLDPAILAPLGCGMQTGAGSVMNTLKVKKGESIAVFGTGSVGLAAIMAARITGADTIIGVDLNPARLDLALSLGATHVIESGREDVLSRIMEITGKGVNYGLEITGDPKIYRVATQALAPKGTLALFTGAQSPGPMSMGRKAVDVIQGSAVPRQFIPRLIELHEAGLFPFHRLITFYDFSRINEAMADSNRGDVIKPVLRISSP